MGVGMRKLRISIVEYLNTAPLVWGFTDGPLAGKYELSFTVPSQCAEALRRGDVDVAIIPPSSTSASTTSSCCQAWRSRRRTKCAASWWWRKSRSSWPSASRSTPARARRGPGANTGRRTVGNFAGIRRMRRRTRSKCCDRRRGADHRRPGVAHLDEDGSSGRESGQRRRLLPRATRKTCRCPDLKPLLCTTWPPVARNDRQAVRAGDLGGTPAK